MQKAQPRKNERVLICEIVEKNRTQLWFRHVHIEKYTDSWNHLSTFLTGLQTETYHHAKLCVEADVFHVFVNLLQQSDNKEHNDPEEEPWPSCHCAMNINEHIMNTSINQLLTRCKTWVFLWLVQFRQKLGCIMIPAPK